MSCVCCGLSTQLVFLFFTALTFLRSSIFLSFPPSPPSLLGFIDVSSTLIDTWVDNDSPSHQQQGFCDLVYYYLRSPEKRKVLSESEGGMEDCKPHGEMSNLIQDLVWASSKAVSVWCLKLLADCSECKSLTVCPQITENRGTRKALLCVTKCGCVDVMFFLIVFVENVVNLYLLNKSSMNLLHT